MGLKDIDKVQVREKPNDGPIQSFLSKMARDYEIWLIGGTIPLVSNYPNKVRNSCLVYNDKGEQVARYDKIHLFGLDLGTEHYHEETTIEAGNQVISVDTPYGKIGLSICYDLRFPELYRAMGEVDMIVIPSAFTETTGKAHWESLIRARAIEKFMLCDCTCAGWLPFIGPRNAWQQYDCRPVGRYTRSSAARLWHCDCIN